MPDWRTISTVEEFMCWTERPSWWRRVFLREKQELQKKTFYASIKVLGDDRPTIRLKQRRVGGTPYLELTSSDGTILESPFLEKRK